MDIVNICSVQSAQAMCNMRTIVWKLSITLAPMLYRKNLHSILWYPTTIIREKTFFIESVRVWYEKYKQNYKVVITIIWLWWFQVLEKVCVWISEQKRFGTSFFQMSRNIKDLNSKDSIEKWARFLQIDCFQAKICFSNIPM